MSDCPFREELDRYNLDFESIDSKMHELESLLGYEYNDIRNLANAMCGIKLVREHAGGNSKDYYNDSLATVGDAIIKAILSEALFRRGLCKGEITILKSAMENNKTLLAISDRLELSDFVFNANGFYPDLQVQDRPPYAGHNQYFEAIVASVYFDSDYETCREWLTGCFFTDEAIEVLIESYEVMNQ